MSNFRNINSKITVGIGTVEIFKPAERFIKVKLNNKFLTQNEKFEYTPWVLYDEVFVSRNSSVTSNNLTKYEYVSSFTKVKNNIPIDIINQYNVYKRYMIKCESHKEKIMKKVA